MMNMIQYESVTGIYFLFLHFFYSFWIFCRMNELFIDRSSRKGTVGEYVGFPEGLLLDILQCWDRCIQLCDVTWRHGRWFDVFIFFGDLCPNFTFAELGLEMPFLGGALHSRSWLRALSYIIIISWGAVIHSLALVSYQSSFSTVTISLTFEWVIQYRRWEPLLACVSSLNISLCRFHSCLTCVSDAVFYIGDFPEGLCLLMIYSGHKVLTAVTDAGESRE